MRTAYFIILSLFTTLILSTAFLLTNKINGFVSYPLKLKEDKKIQFVAMTGTHVLAKFLCFLIVFIFSADASTWGETFYTKKIIGKGMCELNWLLSYYDYSNSTWKEKLLYTCKTAQSREKECKTRKWNYLFSEQLQRKLLWQKHLKTIWTKISFRQKITSNTKVKECVTSTFLKAQR